MPSFFEAMKRIALGKPVFDMQNQPSQAPIPAPAPVPVPSAPTAPRGPRVLPLVVIEQIKCSVDGTQMECECDIQNNSGEPIELDKIKLLGATCELDNFLKPGEQREFSVYSGPRPQNTYANEAWLYYKNASGDYFASVHQLEFQQQADGTYAVWRARFTPPVRDV